MSTIKQFILIPYWVEQTIHRHQLAMAEVLNLKKLREILSVNDLVGLRALQNDYAEITGVKDSSWTLELAWMSRGDSPAAEEDRLFARDLSTLACDASQIAELKSRLYQNPHREERDQEPFITYDLTPAIGGVVIYPGFFETPSRSAYQYALVSAMLKLSYVYVPYNEGSATPLFNTYLRLLSNKQIMV